VKTIPLTQGKVALVDDEDFEFLNQWKWCYSGPRRNPNSTGYAFRGLWKNGSMGRIYMHRIVIKTRPGSIVDHVNRDGLDNRRRNLRIVTQSQNNLNSCKHLGSSSIYKGVHWSKRLGKWRVQISVEVSGPKVYIGAFENERHAAMAYDIWAHDIYGEFANLNFKRAVQGHLEKC